MTSKMILAASTVAVLAIMMAITPAFATSFLDITNTQVGKHEFQITTAATIPKDGSSGAFGYAIFGQTGLIAVTSHGGIRDSEVQKSAADPVLHTHIVKLDTQSGDCASHIQVISASYEPVGKLRVDNNLIQVTHIPSNAVGKLSNTIVSFTLSVETGGAVCVNLHAPSV